MKALLDGKKRLPVLAALVVFLIALAGLSVYGIWLHRQDKFQDLTVELGTDAISLSDFMTEYARPGKVSFVSDPALVNLNETGTTELTLRHGSREQTITFTVEDTTAPEVTFIRSKAVDIHYVPDPMDFVSNVSDADKVRVYFGSQPVIPKDYSDITVQVIAEDGSGNSVAADCVISFNWLKTEYHLEYGMTLTKADVLLDPLRDDSLIDQASLDLINEAGFGEYKITSTLGEQTRTCTVTVADTMGPVLELQDVQVKKGKSVKLDDFIASVEDISGVKEVRLLSEPDTKTESKQTILVEAEDNLGNITQKETILWVATDFRAPKLTGADKSMSVEKYSEPDFLEGVSAQDSVSGVCEVQVDLSQLNLSKAGTYYITYSACDASGNIATVKRKVVVEPNEEDTKALVETIAQTLSDDPEQIRDYVRRSISYSHSWGGDDPVWHGFTRRSGNCYVHAMCLKALFDEKGIESQLIWVVDKSHYWLIVKLDEGWRHIDPTPGVRHTKYSLMTDDLRLATLSGRVWDFEAWPKCE